MKHYLSQALDVLQRLPQQLLIAMVLAYRTLLKPWLGNACRFEPTCSQYFLEAVETHGAVHGGWMGLKRLGRCHPWGGCGCDPVPPAHRAGLTEAVR